MNRNQPADIEIQIEEALARYSSAEPLAGMEQRILNRIQFAPRARPTRLSPTALAAFALSVFICVHLWPVRLSVRLSPQPVQSARAVSQVTQPPPEAMAATTRVHPRQHPRKPNFRAPAPLTPDERALLSLIELHPAQAQQVFEDLHNRTSQPIEIPALEVRPLSEDSLTPKEN
jgi:hypothetical protein